MIPLLVRSTSPTTDLRRPRRGRWTPPLAWQRPAVLSPCGPTTGVICAIWMAVALSATLAPAANPVQAKLGKESAWTGEPVPLIVTLYSPGPFSDTASFELPDQPRTMILKIGSPVVGSEELDGQSYMTQRHEFRLFTQRAGEIVVPSFEVRFAGKPSFTAAPKPMQGTTAELRFESKRPPGTAAMGLVVSTPAMMVTQQWEPDPSGTVTAGDVVVRRIIRTAEGTTAMMLPAISARAPDGVRVYSTDPVVVDNTERGESRAQRTDTLKYQFERAGTFALPELTFIWWDPRKEELKRQTVAGKQIEVVAATVRMEPRQTESRGRLFPRLAPFALGCLAVGLVMWLLRKPLGKVAATWQEHFQRPKRAAARQLRKACATNDPRAAHAALLEWFGAMRGGCRGASVEALLATPAGSGLVQQQRSLSRQLFGPHPATLSPDASSWDGRALWAAFSQVQATLRRESKRWRNQQVLAPLNPTTVTRVEQSRSAGTRLG